MQINHVADARNLYEIAGDTRTGAGASGRSITQKDRISRILLAGEEGSPDNYQLFYGESEGGDGAKWTSPRHRHNFEQIRFTIEGDYSMTKEKVLPAGWVAYFPESIFYGPQVKNPNLKMLVLQFGGPSGIGYHGAAQMRKGFDALVAKGGKFEAGMYTWDDEAGKRHNQDAFEATWEQIHGQKVVYPKPRYDSVILMNPANFSWMADPASQGVSRKLLGAFTEREIRIEFVHLDAAASVELGTRNSAELLFLTQGVLVHEGKNYERNSAFATSSGDRPETLTAVEPTELLYIKLPTF